MVLRCVALSAFDDELIRHTVDPVLQGGTRASSSPRGRGLQFSQSIAAASMMMTGIGYSLTFLLMLDALVHRDEGD